MDLQPANLTAGLLILLACSLAGCQTPMNGTVRGVPGKSPDAEAAEVPGGAEVTQPPTHRAQPSVGPDPVRISALLDAAEEAMDNGRLLAPASESALLLYDRVLSLDPQNQTALRGLESIAQHFLDQALEAAGKRQFEQARAMLGQARLVDPQHPGIGPTAEQIELLSSARRKFIPLDGALLKDRDPTLLETLRPAGTASRQPGCRAVIHARSDSEGRWLYQQMSRSDSSERIRANVEISWPPGIEVLCFAAAPSP